MERVISVLPPPSIQYAVTTAKVSRQSERTRRRSKLHKLTLAIQATVLILVCTALVRSRHILSTRAAFRTAHFDASVFEFCHSDPGIHHQHFPWRFKSRDNCYGDFSNASSVKFVKHGLEAPSRTPSGLGRCRKNPYHALYDCIWPLVHYISSCVHRSDKYAPTVVLHRNSLGINSRTAWGDGALRAMLNGLREQSIDFIDANNLPVHTAVCFRAITKFKKDAEWRPLRFSATLSGDTKDTTVLHTERAKQVGLQFFRSLVLRNSHKRDITNAAEPTAPKRHIVVYDRHDVRRRRWLNGFDFAVRLNRTMGERLRVVYMWRMPKSFSEQVLVHRDAAGIVAPHGAAMANTVFMREDAVVVEIASRHCSEMNGTTGGDVGSLAGTTREDSWTGWHSSRLGLNHVTMPCRIVGKRGRNFVTDNDVLVRVANAMFQIAEGSKGVSGREKRRR